MVLYKIAGNQAGFGFSNETRSHPMGESILKMAKREEMLMSCSGVQTVAGRVQVRWESESAATPMGQLAYFIEFLTLTGLWSRWQESCPLAYSSPNAPGKADVLGTWMLSVLAGHKRYSHVTAIRCDGVNPGLLGMNKVISEDALRNALKRIPQAEGCTWLDGHLSGSVSALLDVAWILDTDTTVKPLYGKQEGALISYNPKKPGRPSHTYHTYLMAGLRQVLGVEVPRGNEHAARHTQPGLLKILDGLPKERKPALVRGDSSFGNDPLMSALEERRQPYLFKLKLSKNVKRHIGRLFRETGWTNAGQGWEGKDSMLTLCGWEQSRRVVVLRRPLKGEVVITQEDNGQQLLDFVEADRKVGKQITGHECAVLVTNTGYEILGLGQLYRDRADAENAFDELKNQWGWGGVHHARPASLPAFGPGGGADLQLVEPVCSPGESAGATRGDHQPPVVDVLGGAQNGACWPDDDNAHWPARRFRQGPGSPDACLRPASGLGRPCCGAVERNDRLDPRL
ncbi:MAG: transposase [Nitrosospira sp.]